MPQMSPIWWMTLMLMFNLTLLIMNSILFFNKQYNFKFMKNNKEKKLNWKW